MTKYGTELEYSCRRGAEFASLYYDYDSTTMTTTTLSCGWDGQWSPYNTLPECVAAYCTNPPDPETATRHVEIANASVTVDSAVDTGCTVPYQ